MVIHDTRPARRNFCRTRRSNTARHPGTLGQWRDQAERDVFFKRVFNAPRNLVYDAWTKREHLARWWGPNGFTAPVCEVDVRSGGAIRIDMLGPNGIVYPMTGVFQEVTPPKRLVFASSALDEHGNPLFEVMNIVTFEENDGKTTMTLHASVTKTMAAIAAQYLNGMQAGWTQSLKRLGECVDEISAAYASH